MQALGQTRQILARLKQLAGFVVALVALLLQALFLGHGGFTTLGADLLFCLDECTPFHVPRSYTCSATERNLRWARRWLYFLSWQTACAGG